MSNLKNILWGVLFIGIGIILGLNALDITNINIFFHGWWTLFIIIPCLIGLFDDEDKTGSLIGLLIGVLLLLCCRGILNFELLWKLAFPAILVMIGFSMIFKDVFHQKIKKEIKKGIEKMDPENEYCSTFSSQTINFDKEEFKGANLTAVFGGVKCDLEKAIVTEDQVICCSAIFGGIDIYVPEGVNVKVKSTSIFGGVSNRKKKKINEKEKTIYINATCLFGGVDIK